jgi:HTH-type transcriptional regulator / antitoxin HigA
MRIRPIRTDEDHTAALKEVERLWGAKPGTPEGDDLDVLTTLVGVYENARWPIKTPDPVETLGAHMEATGRSQSDLARVLGSRPRASEIMARKRRLTMSMVRKIASDWQLPAAVLIAAYPLKKTSARKTPKSRRQQAPKN